VASVNKRRELQSATRLGIVQDARIGETALRQARTQVERDLADLPNFYDLEVTGGRKSFGDQPPGTAGECGHS